AMCHSEPPTGRSGSDTGPRHHCHSDDSPRSLAPARVAGARLRIEVAAGMVVTPSCRALGVGLSLALLVGCASAPRDVASRDAEEPYFARQLPGLSGDWRPAMSPVDNPILE